ncbi:MAG: glycosyltransferase [Pyrinomonadaceae bacterium]|nr:glycosyltransferase [Pyrinomonadaceae bacterium]MBP6213379.1 glycosyltransferase [Pyrinomonadaceae bacterium]
MLYSVSVIIPSYNYGRFIGQAIDSALGQTVVPAEIIVVDDGSTDETETIVRACGDSVSYIQQANNGVCSARNRGIDASSGELIAFLDADDTWLPDKLEKQIAKFDTDPEIGLVHCGMREFDGENGIVIRELLDGAEGWVSENLLLWDGPAIVGPGGTIIVKREAIESVGGFDETIKVGEDWEFCYRVAHKYKVGFVPKALVNYRNHGSNAHKNVAEMERGMGRFYAKAFETDDADVLKLRSRAYGNYHRVLSGSYFHTGNYRKFVEHAVKSIRNRPSNLGYFLRFPLRRLGRIK